VTVPGPRRSHRSRCAGNGHAGADQHLSCAGHVLPNPFRRAMGAAKSAAFNPAESLRPQACFTPNSLSKITPIVAWVSCVADLNRSCCTACSLLAESARTGPLAGVPPAIPLRNHRPRNGNCCPPFDHAGPPLQSLWCCWLACGT
jgi:hypothetical protein